MHFHLISNYYKTAQTGKLPIWTYKCFPMAVMMHAFGWVKITSFLKSSAAMLTLKTSELRARLRLDARKRGQGLGVMPRNGSDKDIKWLKSLFVGSFIIWICWRKVKLANYRCLQVRANSLLLYLHTENPSPPFSWILLQVFVRWKLNRSHGELIEEIDFPDNPMEFPIWMTDLLPKNYTHGYYVMLEKGEQKEGLEHGSSSKFLRTKTDDFILFWRNTTLGKPSLRP